MAKFLTINSTFMRQSVDKSINEARSCQEDGDFSASRLSSSELPGGAKLHMMINFLDLYQETKEFRPLENDCSVPRSKMYRTLKHYQKIIYILFEEPGSSLFGGLAISLLIIGVLIVVGEGIFKANNNFFSPSTSSIIIDSIVLLLFVLEFLLRIFSASAFSDRLFRIPFKLDYILDFIAILPLSLQIFMSQATANSIYTDYKILNFLKVLTILKLLRYMKGFHILIKGFYHSLKSFAFILFVVVISNLLFATMVYYAEAVNPKSRLSQGIPIAIYWSIVTMTTTGYGDVVPITPEGKVIGGLVGIFGMLILALPVVVLGYHFQEIYNQIEEEKLVERLREKEFEEMSSMNRDHKENLFLKNRITNIEKINTEIMDLLKDSGSIYKDVSSDLTSLYKSIYRGVKNLQNNEESFFEQKIKMMESSYGHKGKIKMNQLFQRGFGRSQNSKKKINNISAQLRSKVKKITIARKEDAHKAIDVIRAKSEDLLEDERSIQSSNELPILKPKFKPSTKEHNVHLDINESLKEDFPSSTNVPKVKPLLWDEPFSPHFPSGLKQRFEEKTMSGPLLISTDRIRNLSTQRRSHQGHDYYINSRQATYDKKPEYDLFRQSISEHRNFLLHSQTSTSRVRLDQYYETPISISEPDSRGTFREKILNQRFSHILEKIESLPDNDPHPQNIRDLSVDELAPDEKDRIDYMPMDLEQGSIGFRNLQNTSKENLNTWNGTTVSNTVPDSKDRFEVRINKK